MRDGPPERLMGDSLPIWPRTWKTAIALLCLLAVQIALFLAATQRSFFAHEDLYNFALAEERSFLHYLATPIIHTYPAPGNRLLFFVAYKLFSLNYLAARLLLLALLAATTVLLGHLVRTLARSDEWWTVALLTPFALSLTLVGPVNLWSNGVPVFPTLLFTVVALSAWIRSYGRSNRTFWVGVTVMAIAATTGFYMKFLLIPVYLLFFRLAILPRLLDLPGGIRALWQERNRWLAVAAPPALFLIVYVVSGLAVRTYSSGRSAPSPLSRDGLDPCRHSDPDGECSPRSDSLDRIVGDRCVQPGALLESGVGDMETVSAGFSRMGAVHAGIPAEHGHGRRDSARWPRRHARLLAALLP